MPICIEIQVEDLRRVPIISDGDRHGSKIAICQCGHGRFIGGDLGILYRWNINVNLLHRLGIRWSDTLHEQGNLNHPWRILFGREETGRDEFLLSFGKGHLHQLRFIAIIVPILVPLEVGCTPKCAIEVGA